MIQTKSKEADIIRGMANGLRVGEIAQGLNLAKSSIHKYRLNAMKKVGARTPEHLIAIAYREGILKTKEI